MSKILYRERWVCVKEMTSRRMKRVTFLLQARVNLFLYTIDLQGKPWNVYNRISKLLDLSYLKRNPLIATGVDGSIFLKNI